MGRCRASTDKKICSSHTSACQLSAGWQPLDPTCTLAHDLEAPTWDESYFGKCAGSDDFCAWSSGDCPKNDGRFIWANPFFANSVPDVKTGACVSNTQPHRQTSFALPVPKSARRNRVFIHQAHGG
mmetsp:Transcript_18444/g.43089  ORF Transcript_18444/g.43089 Transcript_18444/m.43089 type:complete len:126 (-) Transcript_18444:1230-1607(-)